MPFSHRLEQNGTRLVFECAGCLTNADFEAGMQIISDLVSQGIRQILVLRNETDSLVSIEEALAIGQKTGQLLEGRALQFAVVGFQERKDSVFIEHGITMNGIDLRRFSTVEEALAWLSEV